MPTECSAELFEFACIERRQVVAAFDGGRITSDAGALLLGLTDRAMKLVDRLAGCFEDARRADLIEHEVRTLVGQRVIGIALGYEDLNDHDELRHDPVMAVLARASWGRCARRNARRWLARAALRGAPLRQRRDGEPHQGMPAGLADRTSAATLRANQLRLWLASFA
jgi:hypothetical protein